MIVAILDGMPYFCFSMGAKGESEGKGRVRYLTSFLALFFSGSKAGKLGAGAAILVLGFGCCFGGGTKEVPSEEANARYLPLCLRVAFLLE